MLRDHSGITAAITDVIRISPEEASLQRWEGVAGRITRKPNLALIGLFDAAKTTMANWLIASDAGLPENYSPTTSVVTYVHHIDDRPDWIKDQVILLDQEWSHRRWLEEGHTRRHRVVGGQPDLLSKYGTHGESASGTEAKFALVFVDAPILKFCNIIDHPGYGHSEQESQFVDDSLQEMDALAYLSNATGFLRADEIARLGSLIRRLPPYEMQDDDFPTLGNLFVVATHAFPQISDQQLDRSILGNGLKRLMEQLGSDEFDERGKTIGRVIDSQVVRSRMFSFCVELPDRCASLLTSIEKAFQIDLHRVRQNIAHKEIEAMYLHAEGSMLREQNLQRSIDEATDWFEKKATTVSAAVDAQYELQREFKNSVSSSIRFLESRADLLEKKAAQINSTIDQVKLDLQRAQLTLNDEIRGLETRVNGALENLEGGQRKIGEMLTRRLDALVTTHDETARQQANCVDQLAQVINGGLERSFYEQSLLRDQLQDQTQRLTALGERASANFDTHREQALLLRGSISKIGSWADAFSEDARNQSTNLRSDVALLRQEFRALRCVLGFSVAMTLALGLCVAWTFFRM